MRDKTPKKINAKGISLISLTVAVCILIVLSSMMIYTTRNGIKIRAYKMLQNDIEILNDKINTYYVKYGALPAEIKYVNTNFAKNIDSSGQKGANDGEDYYVIDLKALEGVTLNYGTDARKIQTEEDTAQYDDVYIINKESHHIYYARGINFDGVWYYTNDVDEEISLYEKNRWTALAEFETTDTEYELYGTREANEKKLNYYALDNRGELYIIDENYNGNIYENTNYEKFNDKYRNVIKDKNIVKTSAGSLHTVAIDDSGKVYTWGVNFCGQLGNGTEAEYSNVPICISKIEGNVLNGKNIVEVSAGYGHTVAIDEEGRVYTWGENGDGQLGNETTENSSPICISEIEGNVLNGKKIVEISAKENNTVAIDEEGKVYTWGNNECGQLGDGTTTNSKVPMCISEMNGNLLNGKKIIEISVGSAHTIAIDEEGKVYTWGDNECGQLGDGTTTDSSIPICISEIEENVLKGKNIVEISAGYGHTVAIDEKGQVYTWGENDYGILGDGTGTAINPEEEGKDIPYSSVPICISEIEGNVLNGKNIVEISAGHVHTVAIDEKGQVYTWGVNGFGILGDGTGTAINSEEEGKDMPYSNVPICISEIEGNALSGNKIVGISAGGNHTVVIDEKGQVYTWGFNYGGQLGTVTETGYSNVPICISEIERNVLEGKKIVGVSAGGYIRGNTLHIAAIDSKGKVYTWECNGYGQLGNGTTEDSSIPICISEVEGSALNGKEIVKILAGDVHTVAIDEEGKVYTWGYNACGQLGDGTTTNSSMPICISEIEGNALNGKQIMEISAGDVHTVAIDKEGKVYTWGYNKYGQLGNETEDAYGNVPICISETEGNVLNGKNIVEISAGGSHTVAIDDKGQVYTWGYNYYGQLGNGTTENSSNPICISEVKGSVLNGKNIVEVSAGDRHTVAIDEEGKVYTWGDNFCEQLGDGTTEGSSIPICISEIEGNVLNGKNIVKAFAAENSTGLIDNKGNIIRIGKYRNK